MRQLIVFLFLMLSFWATAEGVENTYNIKLDWQGVTILSAEKSEMKVLAFNDAKYPKGDRLPYFSKLISVDGNFNYDVVVDSVVYAELTDEEADFLVGVDLPEVINPEMSVQNARTDKYLSVLVFPFVSKQGKIFRATSFMLSVMKSAKPQKAKSDLLHSYADNSVLASGRFVKIKIKENGVYKLTYDDLSSMGINPSNVRIFGYGGNVLEQSFQKDKIDDLPEIPIYMNKGSDGVFNSGDYILFYGLGVNKWTYDTSKSMFTHVINSYSSYGYYFVTSDAGAGKKIETTSVDVPADATINKIVEFVDYKVYEKESYSLIHSGKEFYGNKFSDASPLSISFSFPNPVQANSTKVRLDVASASSAASTFSLVLNDSETKVLSVSAKSGDSYEKAKAATGIYSYTSTSSTFNFSLSYSFPNSTSAGFLNFLEVTARRYLSMTGSYMPFQNVDYLGTGSYNQYLLGNAGDNVQVWNITDPLDVKAVVTSTVDGNLAFTDTANELKQYVAIDPTQASDFSKPDVVGVVNNQNIHGMSAVDMVIITYPDFETQAEELAQAHRDMDGLRVAVVTTDEVYNEFSSGTPDATAYRWIMKMFYDRAAKSGNTADYPKYLLLFGRGTFDNRKLLSSSGDNLILTYQADNSLIETSSYVTDDYFTLLDDNDGTQLSINMMDVGVGRFPVTTVSDAQIVVDKTINYMQDTSKGSWKNQLCFLADDGDNALHMTQADTVASIVARKYTGYHVNKIYLDAYQQEVNASGQSYPVAHDKFHDLLNSGLLLLDYTGHASSVGWTNENILTVAEVKSLTNENLPIWVGATCDFLQFDLKTVSAGEHVITNPYGGGIGILSAARPVYASQNFYVNRWFCDYLFRINNGSHYRVGDAIRLAKNNISSDTNKLNYVYMGDPAVMLGYPDDYGVKTTEINNESIAGNDTLKAMSVCKIKGVIVDNSGDTVPDFNGLLTAVVYDKLQSITTQNNEGDGALTYSDRPNALFSGKVNVENGVFEFTFMLPKDIKYNFGTGRINYYAYDTETGKEAQGNFENFIIGGSDSNVDYETDGPDMNIYLNTTEFSSGDKVNENPVFYAELSDVHSINTIGSGIGHDLLLTIDNDPDQSTILNEYYEAAQNDYTSGMVSYKISGLEDGKHILTFRAWDLLNNSTTKSFDFEVVTGLTPVIYTVSNYPNPAVNSTKIVVNHNRPETVLETTVDIFDLAGRKIWTFSQSNADDVSWDLIGNDGKKVSPGIYLYRVSINTTNSDVYSKTNKLLVVGQ
ncbi:MAG: type IX secretion system sortase PorU [Paludibacter sp.]|nr:type IX secretion system sortase PorU [Paludibacter sp.]